MNSQEKESESYVGTIIVFVWIIILVYVLPILISTVMKFFNLVIMGDTTFSAFKGSFYSICVRPVHSWYYGVLEWLCALGTRLTS